MHTNSDDRRLPERLVILPGLLCDAELFADQIGAFDAQVIDGFYGGVDRIEAMADYALARMPERCAVLGHSLGARVALAVWEQGRDRVTRLALASTGVHGVTEGEAVRRYGLRDLGRSQGIAAMVDAWLPPMIALRQRTATPLAARLHAMATGAGMAVFEAQVEALLHRPDARAVLPSIDCPTLVVVGSEDEWSPVDQHREICAQVPCALLHVVAGAGHMLPAEDPAAFNAIVRQWLDQRAA